MIELKICKRLKEAGFRQDTVLGYYVNVSDKEKIVLQSLGGVYGLICACPMADEIWGALTERRQDDFLAELSLGEIKPFSIETALAEYWLEVNNG